MKKFYHLSKETTDTWFTPPNIIHSLGKFDLDPCCPNGLPWKTAEKNYSLEDGEDGLSLPWEGRVWLNPPYSNWASFVKKLKEHGDGIALISARTETRGFFDHIWDDADAVFFIKRRIKFVKVDMTRPNPSATASVLVAYGKNNVNAIVDSGIEGKLILLK